MSPAIVAGGPNTRTDRPEAADEPLRAQDDASAHRLTTVVVPLRDVDGSITAATLTAEQTECEQLVITPQLSDTNGGFSGVWLLTHAPTGNGVPYTVGLDVRELRDTARQLTDLDWTSAENDTYRAPVYARRVREAVDRAVGMPGRTS